MISRHIADVNNYNRITESKSQNDQVYLKLSYFMSICVYPNRKTEKKKIKGKSLFKRRNSLSNLKADNKIRGLQHSGKTRLRAFFIKISAGTKKRKILLYTCLVIYVYICYNLILPCDIWKKAGASVWIH
jgi:hypothetical protein